MILFAVDGTALSIEECGEAPTQATAALPLSNSYAREANRQLI